MAPAKVSNARKRLSSMVLRRSKSGTGFQSHPSGNVSSDLGRRGGLTRGAYSQHQQSIDDIASALLDDSTVLSGETITDDDNNHYAPIERPIANKAASYSHKINDLVPDQNGNGADSAHLCNQQKPAFVDKRSPVVSRKPSHRHRRAPVRQSRASPPRTGVVGPARPIPRSRTTAANIALGMNPLGMNPPMVVASNSMPLTKITEQVDDDPDDPHDPIRAFGNKTEDNQEVHQKVENMLAATKALKQNLKPVSIPSSNTTSKISRFRETVARKISVTFDRFNPRGYLRETRDQNLEKSVSIDAALQHSRFPVAKFSTAPAKVRHLEGVKIKKENIRLMVSEQNHGKNAVGDGKSLRDRKANEDPFSEAPHTKRRPTKFENRLRTNSVDGSVFGPIALDPFETEKVFDSSINSILPTVPIGTSTPRSKSHGRFSPLDESPTKNHRGMDNGQDAADSDSDMSIPSETDTQSIRQATATSLNKKVGTTGRLRPRPIYSYVPVVDNTPRKKHPSPAKGDLEFLGKELQKTYPDVLGPAAEWDEPDELASSKMMSPTITHGQQKRRRVLAPISGNNTGRAGRAEASNGGEDMNQNRVMSPRKQLALPRSQTERRYTTSAFGGHSEIDELHMDAPVRGYIQIGSREVF
ncbi:hypothetical protein B0H63DRAFT_525514 [Podospora didyma]|uniref:Uncharacterized protein n=1 Tax=Podospora didyma TaxID=330526 RepID=A0AAE0KKQ8_9PEZI|nr:hypothetical protein B0H63DRAFT_525514 [Podospora didyma]